MKAYDILNNLINSGDDLSEYSLGYYDITEKKLVFATFDKVVFDADDYYSITIVKNQNNFINIPLFRVYRILKKQELIWHKEKNLN